MSNRILKEEGYSNKIEETFLTDLLFENNNESIMLTNIRQEDTTTLPKLNNKNMKVDKYMPEEYMLRQMVFNDDDSLVILVKPRNPLMILK